MFSKAKSDTSDTTTHSDEELQQYRRMRGAGGKPGMPSIVSEGLHVTGNMVSDGDVQIDGVIEGDVKGRHLTIGAHGGVVGKVSAEEVMVSGSVTGEIKAKIVTLARTSKVQADITHESLAIEAGAEFEGRCKRASNAKSSKSSVREAGKQVFQQLTGSATNDREGVAASGDDTVPSEAIEEIENKETKTGTDGS